jgi:hypothetical protein
MNYIIFWTTLSGLFLAGILSYYKAKSLTDVWMLIGAFMCMSIVLGTVLQSVAQANQ